MQTKTCCKCGLTKPISEFFKATRLKDGLQSRCKACSHDFKQYYQKNKQRYKEHAERRKQNLLEWVRLVKEEATCQRCREDKHWRLDFHHVDSNEKDLSISEMIINTASRRRIQDEIDKCVVLCKNCHADVHFLGDERFIAG